MVGVWICPENGIKYLQMDYTGRLEKSFVRQINFTMKRGIVKLGSGRGSTPHLSESMKA